MALINMNNLVNTDKSPSPSRFLARLPYDVLYPLTILPDQGPRRLLARALESWLQPLIAAGEMDFLQQRWVALHLQDPELCWQFCLQGRRIQIRSGEQAGFDVRICGRLPEFLLLATRREDPDTLFFQRRLVIEGDTALGLQVKNLLDRLELTGLPRPIRFFLALTTDYVQVFDE